MTHKETVYACICLFVNLCARRGGGEARSYKSSRKVSMLHDASVKLNLELAPSAASTFNFFFLFKTSVSMMET
jgi:hypothetical protein